MEVVQKLKFLNNSIIQADTRSCETFHKTNSGKKMIKLINSTASLCAVAALGRATETRAIAEAEKPSGPDTVRPR
jgi:hypothetical protein